MRTKKLSYILMVCLLCLLFALAGCNGKSGKPNGDPESGNGGETDDPITVESKVLVAYFSCTNTTKGVADTIHKQISGFDIYRIMPAVPYTPEDLNYNTDCRANREQNDPSARPAISGKIENIEQYDGIFLGYPIWWGQAPKIVYTFLESCDHDFDGVTIVPFCTSGSSGIGASAVSLHGSAPKANWKTGARISGNDVSSLIAQMERKSV